MKNWTEGLTVRSANALKYGGFVNKDSIFDALAESRSALSNVPGLGKNGQKEVLEWLGICHSAYTEHCILHLKKLGFTIASPNTEITHA